MAREKKRYTQAEIELATVLHTAMNKSQAEIARELNWTTSKVCRVLKIAREDQGLWREETIRSIVSTSLAEKVPSIISGHEGKTWKQFKQLIEWLKQHDHQGNLRDVHVFRSNRQPHRTEDASLPIVWDRAAAEFGKQVAPIIYDRLANSKQAGVSWGRTLRAIVWALAAMKQPRPWSETAMEFFPLWGEVPGDAEVGSEIFADAHDLGSTKLAEDLAELANKPSMPPTYSVPDLRASLAIMPVRQFATEPTRAELIVELMKCNPNYRRVRRLIPAMDAALLSVGGFKQHGRVFSKSVQEYSGIDDSIFSDMFLGDIGGVLLPNPDWEPPSKNDDSAVDVTRENIQDAWLGVRFDDLRQCAEKAARVGGVGTLVCAVGWERAETLIAAIKAGLCTEVFIDDDLARTLEKMRKDSFK